MKKFKKRSIGLLTSAAMLLSAFGGLAPLTAFAADETVLLEEDYTTASGSPEDYGWKQLDGQSSSNGNAVFNNNGFNVEKTVGPGAASTAMGMQKSFAHTVRDYADEGEAEETRTRVWKDQVRGTFDVEFTASFNAIGEEKTNGIWVDFNGNGNSGVRNYTRLKMLPISGGPMDVYRDSPRPRITSVDFSKNHDIRIRFNTKERKFQIFADGSTKALASTSKIDTFDMTDWGNRTSIEYLDFVKFNIDEQTDKNSKYTIQNFKITQITEVVDDIGRALDAAVDGITIDQLTSSPEQVTEALNALPDSISGQEGLEVSWSSDKPDVISDDGQEINPKYEDKDVILTVKVQDKTTLLSIYKDFKLTVPAIENPNSPDMILARALEALTIDQLTDENPLYITKDLTLKDSWVDTGHSEETVSISWKSSDPSVIGHNGVLTNPKPDADKTVIMTATLNIDGATEPKTAEFTFMVREWQESVLLFSETFEEKEVVDGKVEGWGLTESGNTTGTNTIVDNKLVMTKTSSKGSAGGENLTNRFLFKYFYQPYDEAARTASYQKAFSGRYKLELNIKPHVLEEFAVVNFLGGPAGETPKKAFSLCIWKDKVDIYVSSGNYFPVSSTSINDKDSKIAFIIDTKSDTVQISVNDAAPVPYTVNGMSQNGYLLQGAYFALKENTSANSSITISSVDLYQLKSYEASDSNVTQVQAAMNSIAVTDLADTPAAVEEDLKSLPTEKNGVKIDWTSDKPEYINSQGVLVKKPVAKDEDVTMTAIFSKNGIVRYKTYRLTVTGEKTPQVVLKMAADALDYSDLISGDRDNLNENVKIISTDEYGTAITWESSNPDYLNNKGEIVKHDKKYKKDVTLTATFAYGGETLTKEFDFRIAVDFSEEDAVLLYQSNFTGTSIPSNIKLIEGSGEISLDQENKQLQLQRKSKGSGTGIQVYPTLDGKEAKVIGDVIVETDVLQPVDCAKSELVYYGSNGKRLFTLYTGSATINNPKQRYTVVAGRANGSEFRETTSLGSNVEMHMKVKVKFNTVTRRLDAWLNLGSGEKQIVTGQYLREAAEDLAYIAVNAVDNTDADKDIVNRGVLYVKDVKVSVHPADLPEIAAYNMDYISPVEELGGRVSSDLNLNTQAYPGTQVTWTSSNPELLSSDGTVNRAALKEDTDVVLTLKVQQVNDPQNYYLRRFPLTLMYIDMENLAYGKNAESDSYANTGHEAKYVTDGFLDTSWETLRADAAPYVTIDLKEVHAINRVDLWEAAIFDQYPVKGFVIEASLDGKSWTQAAAGTTIGADQRTLTFPMTLARYVRYRVTDKEEGNSGLREFQVYLNGGDSAKTEADLAILKQELGPLSGLKQNVSLPATGRYGSAFTYVSSIPDNFSNTGVVTQPSRTVSGSLSVTAVLNDEEATARIPVSVLGTSGGGDGGTPIKPGGGSGGGSNTPNSGMVPYPTTPDTPIDPNAPSDSFADVPDSHWAYSYVVTLKKRGIVAGDGNNAFRPEDQISREEFLKMLLGALNIKTAADTELHFTDISESDWSYPYVATGLKIGIVNGVSETEFGAGQSITREDMSVLCDRALRYMEKTLAETAEPSEFTDAETISDYARESVTQMQKFGVINGYEDGTFRPQANASRAEAAKIIYMIGK